MRRSMMQCAEIQNKELSDEAADYCESDVNSLVVCVWYKIRVSCVADVAPDKECREEVLRELCIVQREMPET